MQSLDVIHSFWVVEFRVKQDVVPGRIIDYRVTPNRLGDYKVRCAELCGLKHTTMEKPVHVVTQDVYDQWIAEQTAAYEIIQADPAPNATRGENLYNQMGCKTCHSLNGSEGIGPTWLGVYNSQVELADGTTVLANEAYLTESIKDPNAKIVHSFNANAMPNFGLILTDKQIADLVAFIMTIK
jgi:cytochrome c oxidase subunit 2